MVEGDGGGCSRGWDIRRGYSPWAGRGARSGCVGGEGLERTCIERDVHEYVAHERESNNCESGGEKRGTIPSMEGAEEQKKAVEEQGQVTLRYGPNKRGGGGMCGPWVTSGQFFCLPFYVNHIVVDEYIHMVGSLTCPRAYGRPGRPGARGPIRSGGRV